MDCVSFHIEGVQNKLKKANFQISSTIDSRDGKWSHKSKE